MTWLGGTFRSPPAWNSPVAASAWRQGGLRLIHRRPPPMTSRDELPRATIEGAQRGERAAQAELLRRYAGVLHQLVRRINGADEADALTQGVLERLLVALPKFELDGPASLTTWVFTVAHHFVIDAQRRTRRLHLVPVEAAAHLADPKADPHAAAWRGEVRSALEVAISQLPDDQRRVFVLVHLHEQPLDAVAEAEKIPLGTVKSRLFRAKARLAHALSPQFTPGGPDGEP